MKGLLIWIFPLQMLFKFDIAETTKASLFAVALPQFCREYATWIASFNVPLNTIIGRIKIPPFINPPKTPYENVLNQGLWAELYNA